MSKATGALTETPTRRTPALRCADFDCLPSALEYAGGAESGFNFHDSRGNLVVAQSYGELRDAAEQAARRFMTLGLKRGARVPVLAETSPDFAVWFFGCQLAGLVPVPLPVSVNLGGREAYESYLQRLIEHCGGELCLHSAAMSSFVATATASLDLRFTGDREAFDALPMSDAPLEPLTADEPAYIQYTSGSTHFPRGAVITGAAVMANNHAILRHGVELNGDDRY